MCRGSGEPLPTNEQDARPGASACGYTLYECQAGLEGLAPKAGRACLRFLPRAVTAVLALIVVAILFFSFAPGFHILEVTSGSMKPVFKTGDVIVVVPASSFLHSSIRPGKIVSFNRGGSLVSHRVVSVSNGMITTKGDANVGPDDSLTPVSNVVGTYLFCVPGLGYLASFFRTPAGWIITIAAVLLVVLIPMLVKEVGLTTTGRVSMGSR